MLQKAISNNLVERERKTKTTEKKAVKEKEFWSLF